VIGIQRDPNSLTSLIIGNMVTSVLANHPTPLQIALGVFIHRKKIINHMSDYSVTCSYDELRRYKKSYAVVRYTQLMKEQRYPVTVKHIADNFNAEMSSPNGKVSTHSLAMIECFPETENTDESDSFHRISKEDMKNPVHYDGSEDVLIQLCGAEKPIPPALPASQLPENFCLKQRISYDRADDMDFDFLKV
jgi:hypothetical protein